MKLLSLFSPRLPHNLVYMLQASGYQAREYLRWWWRTPDLGQVMYRKQLDPTPKARLLVGAVWLIIIVQLIIILTLFLLADSRWEQAKALGWLLLIPVVTALALPLIEKVGRLLVQGPQEQQILGSAQQIFAQHPGIKIAVVGSYGKTTMKHALATVIAQGKSVAVTPGNLNTPLGLAEFAKTLTGEEAVLVLEFGESQPGDIAQLCELTRPNFGVITGLNQAHLATMGSMNELSDTIFEVVDYLGPTYVVANGENELIKQRASKGLQLYSREGIGKWRVSEVKVNEVATCFKLKQGKKVVNVKSQLLGQHQIGPLCAVVDITDALGLSARQIEAGIEAIEPFEHRFQKLSFHGATVIDDTYNGNIDGFRAGIDFAQTIQAKRKIYVTPGLVDTAEQKAKLHKEIGRRVAPVFDVVVLMKNSNASFIKQGLQKAGFTGELQEVDDPLDFYNNLEAFVATGDFVLMQNDLTDNYA